MVDPRVIHVMLAEEEVSLSYYKLTILCNWLHCSVCIVKVKYFQLLSGIFIVY